MGGSRKLNFHCAQWHLPIFCKNMSVLGILATSPNALPFLRSVFSLSLIFLKLSQGTRIPPIPGLLPVSESLQGRQTSHFQMLAASTLVVLVTYFPFVQQRLMSASTTQGALGRCTNGLCSSLKSSVCRLPECSSWLCLLPAGLAPAAFRPEAPALDSCVNHWRNSAWGLRFYKHSPSHFPFS